MTTIAIVAASLCVVNVLLWAVLLSRFSRLFSTDDIIRRTRDEMTKMVSDINNNADRDISLIDDKISELRKIADEAELKIAAARDELSRLEYRRSENVYEERVSMQDVPTVSSMIEGDLMPVVNIDRIAPEISPRETVQVQREASTPRVFPKRVEELYQRGYSVEQIAHELSRSTSEVSFALAMGSYR